MPEVSASDVLAAFQGGDSTTPTSISVADGNKLAESNEIQYTPPAPSLPQRVEEDFTRPFIQAQHTIGAGIYWLGDNMKSTGDWGGLGDRITRAGLVMQERAQKTLSEKYSNFTPGFLDQIIGAAPALATFAGMTLAGVPATVTTAAIGATAGLGIAAEDYKKLRDQGHSTAASDAFATAIGVPVGGVTALGFNTVGRLVNPWLSKVVGNTIGKIATGMAMGAAGGAAQATTQGTLETATGVRKYDGLDSLKNIIADAVHTAALYGVLGGAAAYPFVFKQHQAAIDGFQKMGMDPATAKTTADDVLGQTAHVVMDKVEQQLQMTPDEQARIKVNPVNQGEVRPNILDRQGIPMDEFYPSITEPKSSEEVSAEAANNEYVKLEPLNLKALDTEKATTADMRAQYMGSFDSQLARGAYLRDDMINTAPAEREMDAAFWNAHYSRTELQRFLDDPEGSIHGKMVELHNRFNPDESFERDQKEFEERVAELKAQAPDIEKALVISAERDKVVEMSQRFFKESRDVGTSLGTLRNTLENFISNRLYKPDSGRIKIAGKSGLKLYSPHSDMRIFKDPVEAIAGGKKFATTNLADLVAVYNQEMAVVNHGRQFVDALSELEKGTLGGWKPQSKLPTGWEQVGTLYKDRPYVDSEGNSQIARYIFAAPKGIAEGLRPLVDPDWFRAKIPGVATIQQLQAYTKTGLLGLSVFHDLTFVTQTLASAGGFRTMADLGPALLDKTMSTPDWRQRELQFLKFNGTTAITHEVQDIRSSLEMTDDIIDKTVKAVVKAPVLKQITDLSSTHTKFLFGQFQRFVKVESFTKELSNWQASHPSASQEEFETAARQIAKGTNDIFGGRNWEVLGYTKTTQSLLRTFLLAPDWALSMAGFTKNVFSKGAEGIQARGVLFKTIAGGLALNQAINYLVTGHSTFENPRGHKLEFQIAPDVYSSAIRGMPGELVKLFSDVRESGGQGFARYAQGKFSPFASAGVTAASGVNYYGGDIWKGSNEVEKDVNAFWNIASHAMPFPIGLTGGLNYAQREDQPNMLGWGSVLTGVGRFSKPSEAMQTKELDQRVIQAYRNGNSEFVEHQISQGNLSRERAMSLQEDSRLSDVQLHVRHMKIEKALDYYKSANPEARQQLKEAIEEKYSNFLGSEASPKQKEKVKKLYESLEN